VGRKGGREKRRLGLLRSFLKKSNVCWVSCYLFSLGATAEQGFEQLHLRVSSKQNKIRAVTALSREELRATEAMKCFCTILGGKGYQNATCELSLLCTSFRH
jgi:hypothetical protein